MTEQHGFSDGHRVMTIIHDGVVFISEDVIKETLRDPAVFTVLSLFGPRKGLKALEDLLDNTALETWKALREQEGNDG